MELLLNLTWLAISVALGTLLLTSRRRGGDAQQACIYAQQASIYRKSTVWLSYLILIAMLLPVISMTDDKTAMVAPTDGEQITRRYEISQNAQQHMTLHYAVLHADREALPRSICVGPVEILPAVRVFPATPCSHILGRAPPAIA